MKHFIKVYFFLILAIGSSPAATVFDGSEDTNFLNENNWDDGLPGTNNAGRINSEAILSADFNADSGNIIVGYGANASFTVAAGATLTMQGGNLNVGRTPEGGPNTEGSLTVLGLLDHEGKINVFNGVMTVDGRLGVRGETIVKNSGMLVVTEEIDLASNMGSELYFRSGAEFGGAPSVLTIRNDSTLAFEIDENGSHTTVEGDSLQVRLGALSSTLQVDFKEAPMIGQTFDLITGVQKFARYDGVGNGREFANIEVNGLAEGQRVELIYDATVVDQGYLRLEVIPEPAAASLIILFGGSMLWLKRRFN